MSTAGVHDASGPRGLAEALADVRGRIARAAVRSGHAAGDVTLVAVTKTVGLDVVLELARLGVTDFGENRVDALIGKRAGAEAAGVVVRWHMIGRLQTNKLRRALPATDVLHSLDRPSLLASLGRELVGRAAPLPAFVEVNLGGEESKTGFDENSLWPALMQASAIDALNVQGLMTMAPLSDDAEASRPLFRRLRELRDEARRRGYLAPGLSMGMSQDYETAVEEGATHVRVGSALFASRRST
jgi:PLP dependent protein